MDLADVEKSQLESDLKCNVLFSYLLQQSVDYYKENDMYNAMWLIDTVSKIDNTNVIKKRINRLI